MDPGGAPHAALLRRGKGTRFKTGTFSGVRTLAGYARTSNHGDVRFVISPELEEILVSIIRRAIMPAEYLRSGRSRLPSISENAAI